MLEKDHMIDCIFLLLMNKGIWKDAKAFMGKVNIVISDNTFRVRMRELEARGFATSKQIDPLKKHWLITDAGKQLAVSLLEVFNKG